MNIHSHLKSNFHMCQGVETFLWNPFSPAVETAVILNVLQDSCLIEMNRLDELCSLKIWLTQFRYMPHVSAIQKGVVGSVTRRYSVRLHLALWKWIFGYRSDKTKVIDLQNATAYTSILVSGMQLQKFYSVISHQNNMSRHKFRILWCFLKNSAILEFRLQRAYN